MTQRSPMVALAARAGLGAPPENQPAGWETHRRPGEAAMADPTNVARFRYRRRGGRQSSGRSVKAVSNGMGEPNWLGSW